MSNHCFSSFNFPYASSVDLRQSFSDYGRTGPLVVFKDEEETVRCISQKKERTSNKSVRLIANKPTLPLNLPSKVSQRFYSFEKTDEELLRYYHQNIANFCSDHGDILHGGLAELLDKEMENFSWEKCTALLRLRKPAIESFLKRFEDEFCEIRLETLNGLVWEACEEEKLELAGKYYGNCLAYQMNASSRGSDIVLAYPCGEFMDKFSLSRVELCSENDGGLVARLLPGGESFDLPGRICQVSAANQNQNSSVIAVRTDYTCSFFKNDCVQDDDEKRSTTVLGNLACKTKPCSVAVNPFIPGEVIVAMETGSLCMWCEKDASSLHVVKKCSAYVAEEFDWYLCEFGPHPRQVIRSNQMNVEILDLRDNSCAGKDLMTLPSPHFFKDDQFSAIQRHPENPYHYFLATNQSLVIMDERFQQTPVLKWCHSLEGSVKHINVVPDAFTDCQDVLVLVGGYKNHEVHCFQYCYGENTPNSLGMATNMGGLPPRSTSSPWKISSYNEWLEMVDYPNKAEIFPAAAKRLNQPLLGLTCIPSSLYTSNKSLAVLQLSKTGDLFYQCLSPCESTLTEERDEGQVHYYEDLDADLVSSGGCGSSKPVLAEKDQDVVNNWLKAIKNETTQASISAVQESSHTYYADDKVGLARAMIFSEQEHHTQCTFCDIGTSVDDKELIGNCIYCGLDKDISNKLSLARTTEATVLTKAYLGITYEPDTLELFDEDGIYTNPLGVVLLKNWVSDEQTPINLEGESQDDVKQENVSEIQDAVKVKDGNEVPQAMNENRTEIANVKKAFNTAGSQNLPSVNNSHSASSQLTTPKREKPAGVKQEYMGTITDGFSPNLGNKFMNALSTPTMAQGSPSKSSAKKKKLARVAGF